MSRNLTFASLFVYMVSLAATQTAYGAPFTSVRWVALAALSAFGAISWLSQGKHLPLKNLNIRVFVYVLLWSMTVINGEYPLFSSFRLLSHAMVLVSTLVFLPQVIRLTDASKLLATLKIIVAAMLLISYFRPAPLTPFDVPTQFRGIFGNANSFGHMAAVGCLLFTHGFMTKPGTRLAQIQLVLMAVAGIMMIRSGARSSVLALIAGLVTLFLIRGRLSSRNVLIVWAILFIALFVALTMQPSIQAFVLKTEPNAPNGSSLSSLTSSRTPTWAASWQAFKQRPLLGWGFGVDSDTDLTNWNGQFTALGFTKRDTVNDLTFALETGGIVGLFAYIFMLSIASKLWISHDLLVRFKASLCPSDYGIARSVLDAQQAFMSLTVLLIVLFEFDDTAFSAGNFLSVLLWASLGISIAIRSLLVYDIPQKLLAMRYGLPDALLISR